MKKAVLTAVLFFISLSVGYTYPVPDTGQTKCYNNTVEITCPQPGEPFYGQDAQYNINMQSYTKLDSNGNDLASSAPSWAMVRDNVTGLIWEGKTNDGTIHDKYDVYNWIDAQYIFIPNLNSNFFGGFTDWRLPTIKELSFIVDRSSFCPPINTSYFTNNTGLHYLSSNLWIGYTDWSLFVDFCDYGGHVAGTDKTTNLLSVNAVKGSVFENNFIDNNDGTITDLSTGLVWQKYGQTVKNWEEALEYCENLTLSGHNDWRLPNINELIAITDLTSAYSGPSVLFFDTINNMKYWSSTSSNNYPDTAWYCRGGVYVFYDSKINANGVRAVRGRNVTLITLSSFTATPQSNKILLKWSTASEIDNAGFNLYRSTSEDGEYFKINDNLIPAEGSATAGVTYDFADDGLQNRKAYYYKLEDIDMKGTATIHGPVSATPRLINLFNK